MIRLLLQSNPKVHDLINKKQNRLEKEVSDIRVAVAQLVNHKVAAAIEVHMDEFYEGASLG